MATHCLASRSNIKMCNFTWVNKPLSSLVHVLNKDVYLILMVPTNFGSSWRGDARIRFLCLLLSHWLFGSVVYLLASRWVFLWVVLFSRPRHVTWVGVEWVTWVGVESEWVSSSLLSATSRHVSSCSVPSRLISSRAWILISIGI